MNKVVDAAEAAEELRRHFFSERFPLGGGVVAGPRAYGVYTSTKEFEEAKAEAEAEAESDLPLTKEEQRRLEVYGERIRRLRLRRRASTEDEYGDADDEKRRRLLRSVSVNAVREIRNESEDSSPTTVAASRSESLQALDPEAAHHRCHIVAVGLKHWLR